MACLVGEFLFLFLKLWIKKKKIENETSFQIIFFTLYGLGSLF